MAEITVNKITGEVIEDYNVKDLALIPSFEAVSQFSPLIDNTEFSIYDKQGTLLYINNNYVDYNITLNYNSTNNSVSTVTVNPEEDLIKQGYEQGNYTVYYNFLRNQLSSSLSSPFFIDQISSDRTEVRIINNSLDNTQLSQLIPNFINELNDSPYFEDFRLNFSNNNIFIANNILLDTTDESQYTVLIKLYEALPPQIELKDPLTVCLQTADEVSYNVNFQNQIVSPPSFKKIGGPNFNLNLGDKGNTDSSYKNKNELLTTSLTSSYNQIQNILKEKGININLDYSDFNNFVYFSSAEERVRNFYYKVGLIEEYDNEIAILDTTTNSNVSSSLYILENKKAEITNNFDGYERYQYYSSGSSNIYPKTNNTPTYILDTTGSVAALAWLESQLTSGSEYDLESVDRLVNGLPQYIREDSRNSSFILFMDMVGQHFDTMWTYTKDISNKFDGDNRLSHGISKDLVKDTLVSLGVNVYGNNQSNYDLYTALTDLNPTGGTSIPTGSEIIENVINIADPAPQEDLVKGIYKRIFHNLPYLLKKKGSVEGLRTLINSFGVPESVLRISEFGGWNSANGDEYSYYEEVENKAFTRGQIQVNSLNAKAGDPFGGNLANVLFRFKYASGSLPDNNDTLLVGNFGNNLSLEYVGGGVTGSYSGSIVSSSLNVYKGELTVGSAAITAPFFNGEWWSVALNTNGMKVGSQDHTAGDGFKPTYVISTGTNPNVNGSSGKLYGNGKAAFGSSLSKFAFQELRFYTDPISTSIFEKYIMNPFSLGNSIDDVTSDVYNTLFFRAPLGSDNVTLAPNTPYTSIHPRVTGSSPSFIKSSFSAGSSYQTTIASTDNISNKEFIYTNEPRVGLRNRISNKLEATGSHNIVGNTLSNLSSIEQKPSDAIKPYPLPAVDYTEVAFSPQNEINDDIAATYGEVLNIGNLIGDPNNFEPNNPNRYDNYPLLNKEAENYFEKYYKPYNWNDYTRLVKYFDNSLFKMIKDFVPAKSNISTGVVIKPHFLERSKTTPPSGSIENLTYSGSIGSYLAWDHTTDGTGSIHKLKEGIISNFEGGGGGVFNAVNGIEYYYSESMFNVRGELITGSKPYPPNALTPTPFVTQSWQETILTKSGSVNITRNTQQEFYNGELDGTQIVVTDGEANPVTVNEVYIPDSEFIAPYNDVRNRYNLPPPGGFSYSVVDGTKFSSFTIYKIDSNGVDREAYLQSLSPGDTISLRVRVGSSAYNYSFTISSLGGSYGGAYIYYLPPTSLVGQFYLDREDYNNLLSWAVDVIWDPQTGIVEAQSDDISPIYNNISEIRQSAVFMDVDYTSFGSGSLVPINIEQIKNGTATRATVQDSNYTSTGYSNARYNGTRVSSLGFNIPYSK